MEPLIETYYSSGFFQIISQFERTVFGKIPFSIGDVLYLILIFYLLQSIWKTRNTWKISWKRHCFRFFKIIVAIYLLFQFFWGLNYYRQPLSEKMKIKTEYSNQDLINFTEKIIDETNKIQISITKNSSLPVKNPYTDNQLIQLTQNGYDNLASKYPFFAYKTQSIKPSLFSSPLSYMGFSGYLNPFTNEAQFNSKVPKYGLPMTICHEMAHQIGYANESECNFIGFLAAEKNNDLYFKFAANTLALKYSLRAIQTFDEQKSKQFYEKINFGIKQNFAQDEAFRLQYKSFIEKGFLTFYDYFLKLNQQKDGLESYSRFLDLLINYKKSNAF